MAKSTIFILLALGLLFGGHAQAAGVFSETKSFLEGGQKLYQVDIFLNTESQSLNALEGEINYAEHELNFEKITDGGSVINFWIEKPARFSGGKIIFSGGMPGGYDGGRGFLFSVIFSLKKESVSGQTEISFRDFKTYRNDGKGTEEKIVETKNILELEKAITVDAPADVKAPEIFAPYVTQSPDLADGKWVVLFNAQDKGGGISHYEVLESEEKYAPEEIISSSGAGWKRTEDGEIYVLEDQSLKSYVYVRALDNLGNARVAEVVPAEDQKKEMLDNKILSVIIILLVIGIVFIAEVLVFRKKVIL